MPINHYLRRVAELELEIGKLKKRSLIAALLRLFFFLSTAGTVYYVIHIEIPSYLIYVLPSLVGFIISLNIHLNLKEKINWLTTLLTINQKEVDFLENGITPKKGDFTPMPENHPYALDLDIIGENSLLEYVDRTATVEGKEQLLKSLLNSSESAIILNRQAAIRELAREVDWREKFRGHLINAKDNQQFQERIKRWMVETNVVSAKHKILAISLTSLMALGITGHFIIPSYFPVSVITIIGVVQLSLLGVYSKRIIAEIESGLKIQETLNQFAAAIRQIENKDWKSTQLKDIQSKFTTDQVTASVELSNFAKHYQRISSIQHVFITLIINYFASYHIFSYHRFNQWKKRNGSYLIHWLEEIAHLEALESLANLAFNQPDFIYPEVNQTITVEFENLGHPLLDKDKRITNSVEFTNQRFKILTGSNMSGKSTFLRTIGINLVLANMGAPICATKANIHPMPIWASMRLVDNLASQTSYFFAEVKRMKQIMEVISDRPVFVLLDELLRGTNSEDKLEGTRQIILQLIEKQVVGIIATHDLDLCKLSNEQPAIIENICFEAHISDNDISFDFILRNGICRNKSATFLLHKMGVIKSK